MEDKTLLAEERQGEALVLPLEADPGDRKKLYVESYGCQMNFSDSEIVASILTEQGFVTTADQQAADVVLINTCAIRDNAEQRCLACTVDTAQQYHERTLAADLEQASRVVKLREAQQDLQQDLGTEPAPAQEP